MSCAAVSINPNHSAEPCRALQLTLSETGSCLQQTHVLLSILMQTGALVTGLSTRAT